ncbi:unnamed protein product [Trichobilharzia szidati]|nr:unnamed protein product [Trichobilharzia szidati]
MLSSVKRKLQQVLIHSKDTSKILVLIFLYIFQGIPLGISASIPLLFQSSLRSADYGALAAFSLNHYPFSFKLLWAPIVDSVYCKFIGRRKTWLIITQYAIGIELIVMASYINEWFGRDPTNLWSKFGSDHPVEIPQITAAFFLLMFFAATQDIAVDGWAISMLSKENIGWASTCNNVGQTIGRVISYVSLLCLESPEISNKYLRRVPVEGQGLISIPGFFYFWGILFMIFNTLIVLLQHEEHSKLDLHLHHWIKCLCNKFKSKSKHHLTSPNSCQMIITDKFSDLISNKSYNEMHNSTEMNTETLNTDGVQREISYYSEVKTMPELNETEVKGEQNLSLIGTYKVIFCVMQLKVVWMYLLLIIISKVCIGFASSATHLKLVEQGFPRENIVVFDILFLPLDFILPFVFLRWTHGPKPLTLCMIAFIPRLISNIFSIPIIHYTPSFRVDGNMSSGNAFTINNTLSVNMNSSNEATATYSWSFYAILGAFGLSETLLFNFMLLLQMAFNAKISDPAIGGTYITLLNTVSNIAGALSNTISLALINPLTIHTCTYKSNAIDNYPNTSVTMMNIVNSTCNTSNIGKDCTDTITSCVKLIDGYYILIVVAILIGLILHPLYLYPTAKRLQRLPREAFTYRSNEEHKKFTSALLNICRNSKCKKRSTINGGDTEENKTNVSELSYL